MTKIEFQNALKDLLTDTKVAEALQNADSQEEILRILNENGIAVSSEEMGNFVGTVHEGELSEEVLDEVAGGGWLWNHLTKYWNPGYWFGRAMTKDAGNLCK